MHNRCQVGVEVFLHLLVGQRVHNVAEIAVDEILHVNFEMRVHFLGLHKGVEGILVEISHQAEARSLEEKAELLARQLV